MAQTRQSKMSKTQAPAAGNDAHPDAWDRFERAVDMAVARSPLHKAAKPKKAASRAKDSTRKTRKPA
jgi:hypothetical protein